MCPLPMAIRTASSADFLNWEKDADKDGIVDSADIKVRYADSGGYHSDNARNVWMYRDYVIRSFNENKPLDELLVEQLAGDLLPDAKQSQRIATGFLRNSMINEEGGIDPFRLSARGYSFYRPVATNNTAEGRRQNRRIEIVLGSAD